MSIPRSPNCPKMGQFLKLKAETYRFDTSWEVFCGRWEWHNLQATTHTILQPGATKQCLKWSPNGISENEPGDDQGNPGSNFFPPTSPWKWEIWQWTFFGTTWTNPPHPRLSPGPFILSYMMSWPRPGHKMWRQRGGKHRGAQGGVVPVVQLKTIPIDSPSFGGFANGKNLTSFSANPSFSPVGFLF